MAWPSSASPDHSTERHDAVLADELPRHPGHVAGAAQEAGPQQLVAGGRVGHLAPAALDHLARLLQRVEGGQDGELGQLVQAELELGDDAEVAAATAQRPEQIGVLVGRRAQYLAVGGDDLGGLQAVDGEAVAAHQAADAAAEGEPARRRCGSRPRPAAPGRAAGWRGRPRRATPRRRPRPASGGDPRVTWLSARRSMTMPSSQTLCPGIECPPPRTAIEQALGAGVADGGGHVRWPIAAARSAPAAGRAWRSRSRGRRRSRCRPGGSGCR